LVPVLPAVVCSEAEVISTLARLRERAGVRVRLVTPPNPHEDVVEREYV